MNHYAARQRESDKRWDYTCANKRGGTHPVGYCAGYRELDPEDPEMYGLTPEGVEKYNAELRTWKDKYHTDGHAKAEDACTCYRRYLLDTRMRMFPAPEKPETLHRCAAPGCEEFTAGFAEVGHASYWLCDAHRHRGMVEALFREVGESWSSY